MLMGPLELLFLFPGAWGAEQEQEQVQGAGGGAGGQGLPGDVLLGHSPGVGTQTRNILHTLGCCNHKLVFLCDVHFV